MLFRSYTGVLKKVYDSPEWQAYMKKASLQGSFITGDELKAYWAREKANHETMLKAIGEI